MVGQSHDILALVLTYVVRLNLNTIILRPNPVQDLDEHELFSSFLSLVFFDVVSLSFEIDYIQHTGEYSGIKYSLGFFCNT